jgi:DNA-binding MurR/RpiR family transcriptional regulator
VTGNEILERGVPRAQNSVNLMEELRGSYHLLSHSQKRIAEYIVDHFHAIAFSSLHEMAARLAVHPSTIVRLCFRLGLNGFPDLQVRIRQSVQGQLSRADEEIVVSASCGPLQGTTFGDSLVHDVRNLSRTIMGLTADNLNRAVDQVVVARRLYVIADFWWFALAHYFGLAASRIRPDVHTLAPDDGISKVRFAEIGDSDCLVAFTFLRYADFTRLAALWARKRKATIIAITETPISAVARVADMVLVVAPTRSRLPNSAVAPMAVANALLNGMRATRSAAAIDRQFPQPVSREAQACE